MAQGRYTDWSKVSAFRLREETTAAGRRWLMIDIMAGDIAVETKYFVPIRADALAAMRTSLRGMAEAIKAAEASVATPAAPAPTLEALLALLSPEQRQALAAVSNATPAAPATNGKPKPSAKPTAPVAAPALDKELEDLGF